MANPRLVDIAPELAVEIKDLLNSEGLPDLANQVDDLWIVERCRCGDAFCGSFYTAVAGIPYDGCVALLSHDGMINIDTVGGRIVHVEVLYRDDIRAKIHDAVP